MWRLVWLYAIDVLLAAVYALLWVVVRVRRHRRHHRPL
jgi:hypothetical protein